MIQLCVASDRTGSLASVLGLINKNCKNLISSLPDGTELNFTAFGNHSDRNQGLISSGNFKAKDDPTIGTFLEKRELVSGNYGGSSEGFKRNGCSAVYELAIRDALQLDWKPEATKAIVLIGDEEPSALRYGVDWRQQVDACANAGIRIYAVQCLGTRNQYFYDACAQATEGVRLNLDQFSDVTELLIAIGHKENGGDSLEEFANFLQSQNRMSRSLANSFNALSNGQIGEKLKLTFTDFSTVADKSLHPVDPYKYQISTVEHNQDIKSYVIDQGIKFVTGKGFYQLEKSETLRRNREVVLRDKKSGDYFGGEGARNMLGVPMSVEKTVSPRTLPYDVTSKYDIFLQSTSQNRKLMANSIFLYEVDVN